MLRSVMPGYTYTMLHSVMPGYTYNVTQCYARLHSVYNVTWDENVTWHNIMLHGVLHGAVLHGAV